MFLYNTCDGSIDSCITILFDMTLSDPQIDNILLNEPLRLSAYKDVDEALKSLTKNLSNIPKGISKYTNIYFILYLIYNYFENCFMPSELSRDYHIPYTQI